MRKLFKTIVVGITLSLMVVISMPLFAHAGSSYGILNEVSQTTQGVILGWDSTTQAYRRIVESTHGNEILAVALTALTMGATVQVTYDNATSYVTGVQIWPNK
jgi:hypothetical protein